MILFCHVVNFFLRLNSFEQKKKRLNDLGVKKKCTKRTKLQQQKKNTKLTPTS